MPRQYIMGDRAGPQPGTPIGEPPAPRSVRERFGALRNLPPFLKLVWSTSPGLTVTDLLSRFVRALLPVVMLYVGKLIIDEVVHQAQAGGAPASARDWLASGRL